MRNRRSPASGDSHQAANAVIFLKQKGISGVKQQVISAGQNEVKFAPEREFASDYAAAEDLYKIVQIFRLLSDSDAPDVKIPTLPVARRLLGNNGFDE
jgi:hypothetical protein